MCPHQSNVRLLSVLLLTLALVTVTACAPVASKNQWETVKHLNGQGQHDAAIAEAQKILLKNPNDVATLYWLASAYKDKGQGQDAEAAYLKIVDTTEEPDWLCGALANLAWLHMDDADTALSWLQRALKVRPLLSDALVPRNWLYLYQGRYREALAGFEHLLQNPGVSDSMVLAFNVPYEGHHGKAFALLGLGETEAALVELDKAEAAKQNWSAEWDRALIYYATDQQATLQSLYASKGFLNAGIKNQIATDGSKGVEVASVNPGGPADQAGLLVGDVIERIGGKSFANSAEFAETVQSFPYGEPVSIQLQRKGHPMVLKATLGSYLTSVLAWAQQQRVIAPLVAQRETLTNIDQEILFGSLRNALQLCQEHLDHAIAGSEQRPIIEKAISIALQLDPPPAIPEEAVRHAARAEAFLKTSTNSEEPIRALTEFEAALRLAPWWGDAWFNLGIAQKRFGDPAAAIRSLKMFLLAAPMDTAAAQVQREIYGLEVEAERAATQGQWSGQWTDWSSIFTMRQDGKQVSFSYLNVDDIDSKSGFRPGDLKFSGTIEGNRLRGKRVFHASTDDGKRCFGATFEEDATVELGDNGYSQTANWLSTTYLKKSCKVTGKNAQSFTYYRVP